MASEHTTHDAAGDITPTANNLPADHTRPTTSANRAKHSPLSATPPRANQATPSTTTSASSSSAMAAPTHRPAPRPATRRQRAKVPAGAQVHGTDQSVALVTLSGVPSGVSLPGVAAPPIAAPSFAATPVGSPSAPMHVPAQATPAVAPFQPRALLAPAREPWPHDALPAGEEQSAEPPADTPQDTATPQPGSPDAEATATDAAALMQDLGLEPAPGTPEALALLAEAGVAPNPRPR